MKKSKLENAFYTFGYEIGKLIASGKWYDGRWKIGFSRGNKSYVKTCNNYATAKSWANYLDRHKIKYGFYNLFLEHVG